MQACPMTRRIPVVTLLHSSPCSVGIDHFHYPTALWIAITTTHLPQASLRSLTGRLREGLIRRAIGHAIAHEPPPSR